jgi:hypothetical protein
LSPARFKVIAHPLSLILVKSDCEAFAMRYALLVCLFVCLTVCGCRCWWDDAEQRVLDNGGHGVNLWPTDKEERAGER